MLAAVSNSCSRRRVQAKEVLADPKRPHGIDHVLDRGLDQPQVAEHPEQEHRRQQRQREQVEAVVQLAGLADEGDGDDRAGQGAQVQGGAAVGLGDGAHAGGLAVELLGGQCRQRQLASQRIGRLVHGIPFPSVSDRRDGRDKASRPRQPAAQHPCQAPTTGARLRADARRKLNKPA